MNSAYFSFGFLDYDEVGHANELFFNPALLSIHQSMLVEDKFGDLPTTTSDERLAFWETTEPYRNSIKLQDVPNYPVTLELQVQMHGLHIEVMA